MRNNVRELRDAAGLTQEGLAKELQVSRQTVISIETGRYTPSLPLAMKLARQFSKIVEEVFLLDDPVHAEADQ